MEQPRKSVFRPAHHAERNRSYLIFGFIMIAALLIRAPQYGNPEVHLDEEFYLVVGDRMLHGALPYVDIWDRKPIGLFLIYAFARMLGGEGFVQYQILASLAAGATAGCIWLIARRIASQFAASVAAIAYLFWTLAYSGQGGQSPIFYNGLTAFAAWLAFQANDSDDPKVQFRLGITAMSICGLILQIKYTAAPEGMFFGLWFLWRMRRSGSSIGRLTTMGLLFVACGIAPTLLVTLFYTAKGHLHEFVFANFVSIFLRGHLSAAFQSFAKTFILVTSMPLLVCACFGASQWWRFRHERPLDFQLLIGWLLAALLGFVMIGNFYDHYFLPVLVPLLVAAAPMLVPTPIGIAVTALLTIWPIIFSRYPAIEFDRRQRTALLHMTDISKPYLKARRCMFIYDGPPSLFLTTQSCAASRLVYPDHFSNAVEANALGVNIESETARVLATHPGVIVTTSTFIIPQPNMRTFAMVRDAICQNYKLVEAVKAPDRTVFIWGWRGPHAGSCPKINIVPGPEA